MIRLYCVFPDMATALQVAEALRAASFPDPLPEDWVAPEPLTGFPPDGWLGGIYYNIDLVFGTGIVSEPTGELDQEGNPVMQQAAGIHINGLWHGPDETVPAVLQQYRVYPATPACVFG